MRFRERQLSGSGRCVKHGFDGLADTRLAKVSLIRNFNAEAR
jgi:hypothetical protein